MRAPDTNAVINIIKYIIRKSYGDFNADSIDYIIFSGGGTNKILTNESIKDSTNDPNVTVLPGTRIFLNTDDLCPFKGLLQKFAYDKNIL